MQLFKQQYATNILANFVTVFKGQLKGGLAVYPAFLLGLLLVTSSGCRMLHYRVQIGTKENPPEIFLPESPSPQERHAASELASLLNFAYDFDLQPVPVSRDGDFSGADGKLYFLVGFPPPGKEVHHLKEDEYGYSITANKVYFYDRSSFLNVSDGMSGEKHGVEADEEYLDLSVYRFLEKEMGFHWLTRERLGIHFPESPPPLRPGREVGKIPVPVDLYLPAEMLEGRGAIPVDLCWKNEERQKYYAGYQKWLRKFGIVGKWQDAKGDKWEKHHRNERKIFSVPGQEKAAARAGNEGTVPLNPEGNILYDRGLTDFVRYCLAKSMTAEEIDFPDLLETFTSGMGDAGSLVRKYFRYWRNEIETLPSEQTSFFSQWHELEKIYTLERLRESGDFLLRAQSEAGSEISDSARFRLETLLLGHEHLSAASRTWEKLASAADPEEFDDALKQVRRLRDLRRQLQTLTEIDMELLCRRELAHGDVTGNGLVEVAAGLIPWTRVQKWRYEIDREKTGREEEWFDLPPEKWEAWKEYESLSKFDKENPVWFAGLVEIPLPERLRDNAGLLIWGMPTAARIYFNGRELKRAARKNDKNNERLSTALFDLEKEDFTGVDQHAVVIYVKQESPLAPCRAAWFISTEE